MGDAREEMSKRPSSTEAARALALLAAAFSQAGVESPFASAASPIATTDHNHHGHEHDHAAGTGSAHVGGSHASGSKGSRKSRRTGAGGGASTTTTTNTTRTSVSPAPPPPLSLELFQALSALSQHGQSQSHLHANANVNAPQSHPPPSFSHTMQLFTSNPSLLPTLTLAPPSPSSARPSAALPTRSGRVPHLPDPDQNAADLDRDTLLFNDYLWYPSDDDEDPDFDPETDVAGKDVWGELGMDLEGEDEEEEEEEEMVERREGRGEGFTDDEDEGETDFSALEDGGNDWDKSRTTNGNRNERAERNGNEKETRDPYALPPPSTDGDMDEMDEDNEEESVQMDSGIFSNSTMSSIHHQHPPPFPPTPVPLPEVRTTRTRSGASTSKVAYLDPMLRGSSISPVRRAPTTRPLPPPPAPNNSSTSTTTAEISTEAPVPKKRGRPRSLNPKQPRKVPKVVSAPTLLPPSPPLTGDDLNPIASTSTSTLAPAFNLLQFAPSSTFATTLSQSTSHPSILVEPGRQDSRSLSPSTTSSSHAAHPKLETQPDPLSEETKGKKPRGKAARLSPEEAARRKKARSRASAMASQMRKRQESEVDKLRIGELERENEGLRKRVRELEELIGREEGGSESRSRSASASASEGARGLGQVVGDAMNSREGFSNQALDELGKLLQWAGDQSRLG